MKPREPQPTDKLGPILADAAYPLATFKMMTALDNRAMRTARKSGLRVIRVGRRGFVLGADFLRFLEQEGGK